MRSPLRMVVFASLAAACAAPMVATGSEQDERERLQAAHDATLCLEVRGRLDADALARGVRAVQGWWRPTSPVVDGEVGEHGVVRIRLPAMEIRTPSTTEILHIVDRAGVHWYCALDLAAAPPTGVFDLGELRLLREPDSPTVVDDRGRPLPVARVLLSQGVEFPDLQAVTDEHGHAELCRAAPFGGEQCLVVHHADFAPWWGAPTPRVQLDHGGEVRGRVVLPAGADASDFVAQVWIDEAAPRQIRGDGVYAAVTAPLAHDGSYRLGNVPWGTRSIGVANRHSIDSRGSQVDVEVGPAPTTVPDLTVDPNARPNWAMRIRLVGAEGRSVLGRSATIHVSDVGLSAPLNNGYIDWVGQPDEPFAISVPGYAPSDRTTHHTAETIHLRGGHRLALRLALDCARRLPAGRALRVSVICLEGDDPGFYGDSIFYAYQNDPAGYGAALTIARDVDILVATPGRYAVQLEIVRWDVDAQDFDSFAIDAEPPEFMVPAGAERTTVTLSTRFVEAPR